MANDSYSQQRLASDPAFQGRVRAALASVAFQVLAEDPATANHANRIAYAQRVINSMSVMAGSIAPWLVQRPNLVEFETTYDMHQGSVVTAAGDPDIESQLLADWDIIAAGSAPIAPPPALLASAPPRA